jgi:hypothetical protein
VLPNEIRAVTWLRRSDYSTHGYLDDATAGLWRAFAAKPPRIGDVV